MTEIPAFRDYVIGDYTRLLGTMFSVIDTVAFATTEQRLARRLLRNQRIRLWSENASTARIGHRKRKGNRQPSRRRLGAQGLDRKHAWPNPDFDPHGFGFEAGAIVLLLQCRTALS